MTGAGYERFRRDYAPAFLQYLSERGEGGRQAAYELGRRAIGEQLSVLDLARIHHGVLLEVLKTHRSAQELEQIAHAASEFLVEALAVFEMTNEDSPNCSQHLYPTSSSHRWKTAPIRTIAPTPIRFGPARPW